MATPVVPVVSDKPDWSLIFDEARKTPAWREMLDRGRRTAIRHTRGEMRTSAQWSIRDLVIDLDTTLAGAPGAAGIRPRVTTIYADVVRIPKNMSVSLDGTALVIAARRIEIDEQAKVLLDYRKDRLARLTLYTGEIVGSLTGLAVTGTSDVRQLPIQTPTAAGTWLHDTAAGPALEARPTLPDQWLQGASPAWCAVASAFQMAVVLMEPQPAIAANILSYIARCGEFVPLNTPFTAEWKELARASNRLMATGAEGVQTWAIDYGRLLFRGSPAAERCRKAGELERARASRSVAIHYELVKTNSPTPEADHPRYTRHGAQPLGLETLNGAEQPLRSVTLSGAEIVLDDLDRSQFVKTYSGKADIQELAIHADTLVIATALKFPQTQVTIFCRNLYFDGPKACIDTTPVDDGQREPKVLDGRNGAKGGNITLHIERFGTTEAAARHFRTCGGRGQDPDEGGFEPSHGVRHLPPITEADWVSLFTYANRKVDTGTVDAPFWNDYKADKLVYVELNLSGKPLVTKGEKAEPGTGGAGIVAGRPGMGGKGGTLRSTVDEVFGYADLRGGTSGTALGPSKGNAGGTPAEACWLSFTDEARNGVRVLVPKREIKKAVEGPSSAPGPEALEPSGADGACESMAAEAAKGSWRTPLNLAVAVQFARDALASARPAEAREYLVPYLGDLIGVDAEGFSLPQLTRYAVDLADQALHNVDDFGNPPGWVPMLSLESAVGVYERIVESSMQELYTAYYLQRMWKTKVDRQSTLESLTQLLTDQTNETRDELAGTRAEVLPLMSELKQLLLEVEDAAGKLRTVQQKIERTADHQAATKERQQAVAEAFKILGAVIKAIPLPEPYQAATAGLGTIFDTAGNFIDNDGTAFKTLKDQVQTFSTENTESLAALEHTQLADALTRSNDGVKLLQSAATDARKEAQALAKLHDKKVKDHDALVKKEREIFELKKEALIYGRSNDDKAKLVKDTEALAKGFKSWEELKQKELDDGMKDYIEKKTALDAQQDDIKDKQKEVTAQKEELAQKKKDSQATIKAGLKKVQTIVTSIETINASIGKLSVPKAQLNSKWDEMLAKLKVDDPEFQTITSQLAYLNQKKTEVTNKLARLKAKLTEQKNTISTNLVTIHELSMQIALAHEALAPEVAVYAQALGQDAHRDLQQFLYYVVKAYEYQRVEPWGTPYHGAQKLFDDMRNVLEPSDFKYAFVDESDGEGRRAQLKKLLSDPAPDRNSRLTRDEFNLLRVVYEKPLRDMGKQLLQQLMKSSAATEAPFSITLRSQQLQELNDKMARRESAETPFDLVRLRHVDQRKERQRIGNIRVTKVTCQQTGTNLPDRMTFRFTQYGKSLVRSDGRIYAFEPESAMSGASKRASAVSFETVGGNRDNGRWEVDGNIGVLKDGALWQPTPTTDENLLAKLLASDDKTNAPSLIKLSEFRPGAFSDFILTVEVNPPEAKVVLKEIELLVTTEGTNTPTDEWIVCASTNVPGMIPFTTNKPDCAGHLGGLGRYVGVFKGTNPVELRVPAVFGELVHSGWIVDGEPFDGSTPVDSARTVTVAKSSYVVALYAKPKIEPAS